MDSVSVTSAEIDFVFPETVDEIEAETSGVKESEAVTSAVTVTEKVNDEDCDKFCETVSVSLDSWEETESEMDKLDELLSDMVPRELETETDRLWSDEPVFDPKDSVKEEVFDSALVVVFGTEIVSVAVRTTEMDSDSVSFDFVKDSEVSSEIEREDDFPDLDRDSEMSADLEMVSDEVSVTEMTDEIDDVAVRTAVPVRVGVRVRVGFSVLSAEMEREAEEETEMSADSDEEELSAEEMDSEMVSV